MRQKVLLWVLVAALLSFGTLVSAQDEVVELVFRQFDPPGEVAGLVQKIEEWNAANPNIQVRLENIAASEYVSQYVREVQAGGGPDVQLVGFVVTADLAANGQAVNLDPFIEADPPGQGIEDFLALDLATYDGSIYGIPWTADTFVLAYRTDAFEEIGATEGPDTWADLQTLAASLTADTDGNGRIDRYGFCFSGGGGPQSAIWFLHNYYVWSNGATIYEQNDAGDWQIGLTAEDIQASMDYFNSFFVDGSTPTSLIGIDNWADPEITGGIARGDCAISFFPPISFRAAEAQADVPLLTTVMPTGTETRISHLGGRSLVINPNSQHQEAAYVFIKYLVSPTVFEAYNQYPAQISVLETLEVPDSEIGYVNQLPLAITFAQYVNSPVPVTALWAATAREYQSVFSEQKTSEQAAADLLAEYETLLAQG
jgi:multiple sugar transport system substrate-binding protein